MVWEYSIHTKNMIPIPGQTKGLSVDGGSLLLNLFMYWSLLEGLMHKGIIRLLKGVFMNKHSVSLALDMCVLALGHLNDINVAQALYERQCNVIVDNIKSAKDLVSEIYSSTSSTDDRDMVVRIDDSLAKALGYMSTSMSVIFDSILLKYAYKALDDATTNMALLLDGYLCESDDEEDSEIYELLKDDGINRPWGVAGYDDPIVEYEEE